MKNIKELDLSANKLFKDSIDFKVVREIFAAWKKMEKLSLQENSISPEYFRHLVIEICTYKHLKYLNLSRNNLNKRSIRHLIKCMNYKRLMNLEFLDLSFNSLFEKPKNDSKNSIESSYGFTDLIDYYIKNPQFIPTYLAIRGMNFCKKTQPVKENKPSFETFSHLLMIKELCKLASTHG